MVGGIFSFLAQIAGFVFGQIDRKQRRKDRPLEQTMARKAATDQAIARGDVDSLNRQLDDLDHRLRGPDGGDPKR